MEARILKPEGIYQPTPDYAHGIALTAPENIVYTAGTMGLELDGSAKDSIDRQLKMIWDNIRAILAAANMKPDNIVRLTSYLSDRKYAAKNTEARMQALKGRAIPTTAIICDLYHADWLVEIECIAAR